MCPSGNHNVDIRQAKTFDQRKKGRLLAPAWGANHKFLVKQNLTQYKAHTNSTKGIASILEVASGLGLPVLRAADNRHELAKHMPGASDEEMAAVVLAANTAAASAGSFG